MAVVSGARGGVGAGAPGGADGRSGHGWAALPRADGPGAVLLHFPVRGGGHPSDSGAPGVLELASSRFQEVPEALAAWGQEVVVVFPPPDRASGPGARRVGRMRALATLTGRWHFEPESRLEALASLPGEGRLAGLARTERSTWALLGPGARRDGWALLELTPRGWEPRALPWEVEAAPSAEACARLLTGAELGAAWWEPGAKAGVLAVRRADGGWSRRGLATGGWEWRAVEQLAFVDDQLVAGVREEGAGGPDARRGLGLWVLSSDGVAALGAVADAPVTAGVVPLDGAGRVAVVWARGVRAGELPGHEVRERSVFTGAVLYEGSGKSSGMVSETELRLLTLALGVGMALAVLLTLRPGRKGPIVLPQGTSAGHPGARLLATLIDLGPGVLGGAAMYGVAPSAFVTGLLDGLERGTPGPLLAGLLMSGACAAISEWLSGRSIGKIVLGLRVVELGAPGAHEGSGGAPANGGRAAGSGGDALEARPGSGVAAWRACVRNAVKWGMPLLLALTLTDEHGRHPGDWLGGTMVIGPVPAPEAGEDES